MTIDTTPVAWKELSRKEAATAMRGVEKLAPDIGAPLDFEDCLLLGLWRRLDAGDRMIPSGAYRLLESRIGHLTQEFERDRLPERWVHGAEVHGLLAGILVMRMIAMMGGSDTEAQQAELLAGEGLTLALLVPRVYYAGGSLLDFMKRAEHAGSS